MPLCLFTDDNLQVSVRAGPGNWPAPFMKPEPTPERRVVIGLDTSIANTGIAVIEISSDEPGGFQVIRGETVPTSADWQFVYRLGAIESSCSKIACLAGTLAGKVPVTVAVEGYAFGSKFGREIAGSARAAALLGVRRGLSVTTGTGGFAEVVITPREAKVTAAPGWPGLTKANWLAAGYTGKFKMSMPTKEAVYEGLSGLYGVDMRGADEHSSDAIAVALAAAIKLGYLPRRVPSSPDRRKVADAKSKTKITRRQG